MAGRRSEIGPGLLALGGATLIGRAVLRRAREADLRGQVALVTGGSRGLGLLIARELAHEGCKLIICSRDADQLDRAREELERLGAEVLTVQCDLSDRAQAEDLIQEGTRRFGRIDLLVNNAGIIQVGPAKTMTVEDFEEAMGINYWGTVYPTLAVLPQMLERRGGRICNITSVDGRVSTPHLLPYNCAKWAQTAFSEGLGSELARDGIVVTTISPGVMRTGSFINIFVKGQWSKEYTWFALASSLPLLSMSANRAARQIVRSIKRGERVRILSTNANILARFHGLLPDTTVRLLGVVNRVLPAGDHTELGIAKGLDVQARIQSRPLEAATTLGRSAAERFNEYPKQAHQ